MPTPIFCLNEDWHGEKGNDKFDKYPHRCYVLLMTKINNLYGKSKLYADYFSEQALDRLS